MMFYTTQQKKWSCRSILGVVFGVIIFSGLFFGLFSKKAFASNNYIDNIHYYRDENNVPILEFRVKTTFTLSTGSFVYPAFQNQQIGYVPLSSPQLRDAHHNAFFILPDDYSNYHISQNTTFTFTAGNTYKLIASFDGAIWTNSNANACVKVGACYYNGNPWVYTLNPTSTDDYLQLYIDGLFNDPEQYYFMAFPSVSVSYPNNNDELLTGFNVQGSFTIPAGKSADYISINFSPVGSGYSLLTNFSQYIAGQNQGTFSIPVSGIPAGYYDIIISFIGGDYDGYIGATIHNVHLVNDISPALSSGETTPSSPNFHFISPDDYYLQHSNFSTSTGLFNNLTNSVGALIQSVGNSLSAFAGKFSLSDAQKTATMVATSISTIRTYSNNLNSFFGSLPVSQIIFLYLIIFVAVIIFRLIKNLVNLIKP